MINDISLHLRYNLKAISSFLKFLFRHLLNLQYKYFLISLKSVFHGVSEQVAFLHKLNNIVTKTWSHDLKYTYMK